MACDLRTLYKPRCSYFDHSLAAQKARGRSKSRWRAVTAAVVGVILNLAVWFGINVLLPDGQKPDFFAIAVGAITFAGMMKWKWGVIPLVIGAGVSGLIFKMFLSMRKRAKMKSLLL